MLSLDVFAMSAHYVQFEVVVADCRYLSEVLKTFSPESCSSLKTPISLKASVLLN